MFPARCAIATPAGCVLFEFLRSVGLFPKSAKLSFVVQRILFNGLENVFYSEDVQ